MTDKLTWIDLQNYSKYHPGLTMNFIIYIYYTRMLSLYNSDLVRRLDFKVKKTYYSHNLFFSFYKCSELIYHRFHCQLLHSKSC